MGFFDLFKKKPRKEIVQMEPILAKLLFNNHETFDLQILLDHLKTEWNSSITNISGGNGKASFQLNGETIILTTVTEQIPFAEIKSNTCIAYNWDTAEKDLKKHNVHVVVTIVDSQQPEIERAQIHNKVLASILINTNCLGIYHLSQQLLIPSKAFLEIAQKVKTQDLPNWD
ncbi:MAG: hypothetical protein RLY89_1080 [Bacteroidota bacterium]|jgi:hypothetical protein